MSDFKVWLDSLENEYVLVSKVREKFSMSFDLLNPYLNEAAEKQLKILTDKIYEPDISKLHFIVDRNIFSMRYEASCKQFPDLTAFGKTKEVAINSIKRLVIREILNKK